MKRTTVVFRLFLMIVVMAYVCGADYALAQEDFDSTGKIRIEGSLHIGGGLDSVDVGTTTDGESISLSGGGGLGLAFGLGYGVSHGKDIDLAVGVQESSLIPSVGNAEGTFMRSYLLVTLNYKVPFSATKQIRHGIGLGYYVGGEYDVDSSQIPFGGHTVVEYDNALGFHLSAEIEAFHSGGWSNYLRLRLYYVEYSASTATMNGLSFPVEWLVDDIRELNGSGIDIILGLARYF